MEHSKQPEAPATLETSNSTFNSAQPASQPAALVALPTPPPPAPIDSNMSAAPLPTPTPTELHHHVQQQPQLASAANDLDGIIHSQPTSPPPAPPAQPNGLHNGIHQEQQQQRVASPASVADAQAVGIFPSAPSSAVATPLEGSPAPQQQQAYSVPTPVESTPAPIVAPPAPISAPEQLPPPPVVPLPSHLTMPPQLQHHDSTSSVIAQPPTPAVAAPPPPPVQSLPPPPPPQQLQQQYTPSPAPVSPAPVPVQSYPSPAPAPAPPAPAPAPAAYAYEAPQPVDVKMEEGLPSSGEVSPGLLKRSAPDELSAGDALQGQQAVEERDIKRARVDSEPAPQLYAQSPAPQQHAYSASPAPQQLPPAPAPAPAPAAPSPAPVHGYDPSAFSNPPSLPPSQLGTPAPAPAPTMSPAEMHQPQQQAPAPQQPQQVPQQQAYQPNPAYAATPAPTYSAAPTPLYPAAAPVPQQHYAPPPQPAYAAAQPTYAYSPAPEAPASATATGPIAVMTKEQQKFGVSLLRTLKKNRSAPPFLRPVDPVALLIPDYFRVVTRPMDLGTVEQKLSATGKAITAANKANKTFGLDYTNGTGAWEGASDKVYRTAEDFKEDVERIWENCFKYNGPREKNPVSAMAGAMQDVCERMWRTMPVAPAIEYKPEPPRQPSPEQPKKERRLSNSFVPTIRRSEDGTRPKREIHAPPRELPYYAEQQETGLPGKSRHGRVSGKAAQEQLRFCKEVIKELFKKVHEAYAFPFYEPVNYIALNIPQYPQIIKKPMDLGTIRAKLDNGLYPLPPYPAFEADMRLIFKNCYAFNPPGTPVNDWGRRLEMVFDQKWNERPIGGDDDEFSDDDGISAMEQQLLTLQASIEQMKQQKKAEKERARAAERAAARPPKPAKKPSVDGGRRASGGGGSGGVSNKRKPGGGKKKKAKRDDFSSDDDFYDDGGDYVGGPVVQEPESVTFEMKRELAVKIVSFEGENLERAIDIIRQGRPDLLSDVNKEIELDIDQLDQRTLLALYRFVCPSTNAGRKPKAGRRPNGSGSHQPGPTKRKNLDEIKESERIEMLEARLREFDQGAQQQVATPSGGGERRDSAGAPLQEDQASSDSSSEEESGSDSDDD
ncbi:hypothetical protein BCR35DRAFT_343168 [Leucosporidium creatinivorum]|uniref:Bromodomain-containing protein n=1 Tax=Leucosporidium creatinivorum TaxID=106004 RepID=A0A1Y2EXJ5_9BASI|nr:hypothetical protein BCR35DRAFT_343168 [Leucosporidium creatinivorum]